MTHLLDSYPLIIIRELAERIGLNEAIVVQQVHYWIEKNKAYDRNKRDGRYWTYNTYSEWQKQFPFWSMSTVKRIISGLESQGILLSSNYNKSSIDRTKWYTIDYDTLSKCMEISSESPLCQIDPMEGVKLTPPIPDTNYTDINNNNPNMNRAAMPLHGSAVYDSTSSHVKVDAVWDEDTLDFMRWYYDTYAVKRHVKHPKLTEVQKRRVHDTLLAFDSDTDYLCKLALCFFANVKHTDYNIRHFATAGILELRQIEAMGVDYDELALM